jgi:hypothetical protein
MDNIVIGLETISIDPGSQHMTPLLYTNSNSVLKKSGVIEKNQRVRK